LPGVFASSLAGPYYEEIVANLHSFALIVGVPLCGLHPAKLGLQMEAQTQTPGSRAPKFICRGESFKCPDYIAQQCQLFIKVRSLLGFSDGVVLLWLPII